MENVKTLINCIKQDIEELETVLTLEEYKNDLYRLLSTVEFIKNQSIELEKLIEKHQIARNL